MTYERAAALREAVRALAQDLTCASGPRALSVHWDMDGTLLDSEPLHVAKLLAVCARHGVALHADDFARKHCFSVPSSSAPDEWRPVEMTLHGAGDKNIYYWAVAQRPQLREELSLQAWYDALMAHYLQGACQLQLRPGVADLVAALDDLGASQDLVTSATPEQLRASREPLQAVSSVMRFVVDAQSVQHPKPHPEGYRWARAMADSFWAARGIAPQQVLHVGIEDSPTGVRALLAAGLPAIQFLLPGQAPVGEVAEGQVLAATCVEDIVRHLSRLLRDKRP